MDEHRRHSVCVPGRPGQKRSWSGSHSPHDVTRATAEGTYTDIGRRPIRGGASRGPRSNPGDGIGAHRPWMCVVRGVHAPSQQENEREAEVRSPFNGEGPTPIHQRIGDFVDAVRVEPLGWRDPLASRAADLAGEDAGEITRSLHPEILQRVVGVRFEALLHGVPVPLGAGVEPHAQPVPQGLTVRSG